MPQPSLVILLVDDPPASARFYADLLGKAPTETSPTFAMLPLHPGMSLGLWSRHAVAPPPGAAGGGTELAFVADDVDATFADWTARGLGMLQPPADLDFGRSFTAIDPDGHRLRVFRPA